MSPYTGLQKLALAGALLITLAILLLSIVARFVVSGGGSGKRR